MGAADQKRDDQDGPTVQRRHRSFDRRLLVEKCRRHPTGHPAAAQRFGQLLGGHSTLRVPRRAVAHHHQPDLLPLGLLVAEQLVHPAGDQGRHPGMRPDRRGLPQAEAGHAPVPRQPLGQDHLGVVASAGEERHHGHLVGRELVEHGVEAGLALVKGNRDLVEQATGPERLRQQADQRVSPRITARAVGGQDQRATAHRWASWGSWSKVGSSRPVTPVRRARTPSSRW